MFRGVTKVLFLSLWTEALCSNLFNYIRHKWPSKKFRKIRVGRSCCEELNSIYLRKLRFRLSPVATVVALAGFPPKQSSKHPKLKYEAL